MGEGFASPGFLIYKPALALSTFLWFKLSLGSSGVPPESARRVAPPSYTRHAAGTAVLLGSHCQA